MFINIGRKERILRIVVGLVLLSLTVVGPQTAWGFIGLIPLVTGLVGNCAIYSLLGMSTASSTK